MNSEKLKKFISLQPIRNVKKRISGFMSLDTIQMYMERVVWFVCFFDLPSSLHAQIIKKSAQSLPHAPKKISDVDREKKISAVDIFIVGEQKVLSGVV
jgi:hypothetical protein